MRDYSSDYSAQKKSNIYFGLRKNLISFKPFLESLSFERNMNVVETNTFYNISMTTEGVDKVIKKLTFNVVSSSVKEAIANHKKFHKLLRMITPTTTQVTTAGKKVLKQGKSEVYIYFANLISDTVSNVPPTTFDKIQENGILFNTKGIEYAPDLDLGFFDQSGMVYAKSFKISMDLSEVSPKNRKKDIKKSGSAALAKPGDAFGFSVKLKQG